MEKYYASKVSLFSMSKKNGIERGTLRYWMNKYPMNSESLSLPSQPNEDVMARRILSDRFIILTGECNTVVICILKNSTNKTSLIV